jgi:hypothetical protein
VARQVLIESDISRAGRLSFEHLPWGEQFSNLFTEGERAA